MRIMAVGAHAFDAEVLGGALIAKAVQDGGEGLLVHMTLGERGRPDKEPAAYAEQLKGELQAAARVLGCEALWMGYPAGEIPVSQGIAAALARVMRQFRPDLVVSHWRGSWHPRHVSTYHNVLQGVALAADPTALCVGIPHRVSQVLFGENCEDLHGFDPWLYVDISKVLEQWTAALACYELYRRSVPGAGPPDYERTGIPYATYYRAMPRVRGLEAGVPFAQAFMACKRATDSVAGLETILADSRLILS